LKLQSLNISNLNIDYELKNRQLVDNEHDELMKMRRLANPFLIERVETEHSTTSWADSQPNFKS